MRFSRIFLCVFSLFLTLGFCLAEPFELLNSDVKPIEKWSVKQNVRLTWNAEAKTLSVSVEPQEFRFGWLQIPLPAVDYAPIAGIYGQFCAPKEDRTRHALVADLLFPVSGGKTAYYAQDLGQSTDSRGEWIEFYLPIDGFLPLRDTTQPRVTASLLKQTALLELQIGHVEEPTTVEYRALRLVTKEEAQTLVRRVNRMKFARLLKTESELEEGVHPRLLMHGKRLERLRKMAAEKDPAMVRLLQLAEATKQRIAPENPFETVFSFENQADVTAHRNRGRFEGTINRVVVPFETLAAAAIITKNDELGRTAARILVNMARTLDVNSPEIDQGFYYTRTFYVRALAFGYDWLYDWLTPEERRDVKITLLGFVQNIYDHSWTDAWGKHPLNRVWNWDPGLAACAGLGVLAMHGETLTAEEAMLIEFRRHLRDYLTFGVDFDGACHEGPSYISYGIGAGVQFAECLRDLDYGDLFLETNWHIIAPWLVAEMLPNKRRWNNLSDCNHGVPAGSPFYAYTCGRLAELAQTDPVRPGEKILPQAKTNQGLDYAQHFREFSGERRLSYGALAELMGWAWNVEPTAVDPEKFTDAPILAYVLFFKPCPVAEDPGKYLPESQFFRGRGMVVSREFGYGPDAYHLAVEAGPHACGHDQSDKGTFTLRALGQDFVIDSGYGNDGEKFKSGSSFAHNIVLIDGAGQPMNWHNNSNGEITGYSHSAQFDWIRTDAKAAWNFTFARWAEEPTGMEVEHADRHYVFVRDQNDGVPPYLVTYDDFRKKDGKEHDFTYQLHTSPDFTFDVTRTPWRIIQDESSFEVLTTAKEKVFGVAHGKAVFTLKAPKDGRYVLAAITRCGGVECDKSDSFYVKINDGKNLTWDLPSSPNFSRCTVSDRDEGEVKLDLKAGETVPVELTAREPESQLAFLGLQFMPPDAEKPANQAPQLKEKAELIPATQAVQDAKMPFLLTSSVTRKIPQQMAIFPMAKAPGKTEVTSFQTSQIGVHPRLAWTVRAVEPEFLVVLLPLSSSSEPLPTVEQTKTGALIHWPNGKTDSVSFLPGKNGKEVKWERK